MREAAVFVNQADERLGEGCDSDRNRRDDERESFYRGARQSVRFVAVSLSHRFGKIRKQEIGCDERKQPDDDDVELVCVAECRYCATVFDARDAMRVLIKLHNGVVQVAKRMGIVFLAALVISGVFILDFGEYISPFLTAVGSCTKACIIHPTSIATARPVTPNLSDNVNK